MSKLKTRKSAAKRFKATATGKFMRRRAFHNHLLDHKSSKLKRHLSTKAVVCLLYTSPSPRDRISSRMPSSA